MTDPRYIIPSYLRSQAGLIAGCDRKTKRVQCVFAVIIGFGLILAVYTLIDVYLLA